MSFHALHPQNCSLNVMVSVRLCFRCVSTSSFPCVRLTGYFCGWLPLPPSRSLSHSVSFLSLALSFPRSLPLSPCHSPMPVVTLPASICIPTRRLLVCCRPRCLFLSSSLRSLLPPPVHVQPRSPRPFPTCPYRPLPDAATPLPPPPRLSLTRRGRKEGE